MSTEWFRKALFTCAALAVGSAALMPLPSRAMLHEEHGPATETDSDPSIAMSVSQAERAFIEEAVRGGMAEVEMGQLAEQRAQSPKVKAFGRRIVHDQSQLNTTIRGIASSKGVVIPAGLDEKSQKQYDGLQMLRGARFDQEYMAAMVSDHKKQIRDFRKEARSAEDGDVKDFVKATLPTLEEQLKIAEADVAAIQAEKMSGSLAKSSLSSAGARLAVTIHAPESRTFFGAIATQRRCSDGICGFRCGSCFR